MVRITVDESYAFDYLSIIDVKRAKFPNNSNIKEQYNCTINGITKEIGKPLFKKIMKSKEYADCFKANLKVFDLVELAKRDECLASTVDKGNFERCKAKEKLQRNFFDSGVSEVKFGYETYER